MNIAKRKLSRIGAILTMIMAGLFLTASIVLFSFTSQAGLSKISQRVYGSFSVSNVEDGDTVKTAQDAVDELTKDFSSSESDLFKNAKVAVGDDQVGVMFDLGFDECDLISMLENPLSIKITNSQHLFDGVYGGVVIDRHDFEGVSLYEDASTHKYGIKITLNAQGIIELSALSTDIYDSNMYYYLDEEEPQLATYEYDQEGKTYGYIFITPCDNLSQANLLLARAIAGTNDFKLTSTYISNYATKQQTKTTFLILGGIFCALFALAFVGSVLIFCAVADPRQYKDKKSIYLAGAILSIISNIGVFIPAIFLYVALEIEDNEPKQKDAEQVRLQIPSVYKDPERAKKFVKVLRQMRDSGQISKEEYKSILGELLKK